MDGQLGPCFEPIAARERTCTVVGSVGRPHETRAQVVEAGVQAILGGWKTGLPDVKAFAQLLGFDIVSVTPDY